MLDMSEYSRPLRSAERPRIDPSYLAFELFDQIVGFATEGTHDIKSLRNFSCVSKQWRATVQPRMYSKWEYDGQYHSITSLWQFLRTIIDRRELADALRMINIRTWTLGLVRARGGRCLSFSDHDLGKLKDAIYTAGLHRLESSFMEALQKKDPRPLMALLMALTRNLNVLYAELPETDIFFAEVLRKATEDQQDEPANGYYPLHNLHEVYLTSSWNYDTPYQYRLNLGNLSPIFLLPSVRKLSIFDFESVGASTIFESCPRSSSITDLALVHQSGNPLKGPDIKALLTLPKALTNLSIHINGMGFYGESNEISNAELWGLLRQHDQSIESLDIYRTRNWANQPRNVTHMSHFGSMKTFTRLHSLCIQPQVLLGGSYGNQIGMLNLVDSLPPNLKTLTTYGDEVLVSGKSLAQQIRDVVTSSVFPLLEHLILENNFDGMLRVYSRLQQLKYPAESLHNYVQRACEESNITYEAKDGSSLTKGGKGSQYYQDIEDKRRSMRKSIERTRESITDYLNRLKEETYEQTGNRTKPTIDDLDEFELPWKELSRMHVPMGPFHSRGSRQRASRKN